MAEISDFNSSTDLASANYLQPMQKIPEKDMTTEWYLQNARWIASNYNQWINNLIPNGSPASNDNEFIPDVNFHKYYLLVLILLW